MTVLYFIARLLAKTVNLICFNLKVYNRENNNNDGNCMIVSNHVTWWDPVILGGVFRKQVHYMSKAELFRGETARALLNQLGAFPVERGQADFGALKKSIQLLKSGKCLGIFPEGTRIEGGFGEFQKGAAAIAIKTNARIIPVCFDNPYKMFKKRCRLIIGESFRLSEKVDVKEKDAAEKGTVVLKAALENLADVLKKQVKK